MKIKLGINIVLICGRLGAVSLLLENPWGRTQNKSACERDCELGDMQAAKPQAVSSAGVGRRATPALLAVRGFACHVRTLTTAHLFCVPLCVLPRGFSSKRETARSLDLWLLMQG